jgi:hypothetical protein
MSNTSTSKIINDRFNEIMAETIRKSTKGLQTPNFASCMILFFSAMIILITSLFFILELQKKAKNLKIRNVLDAFNSVNLLEGKDSEEYQQFITNCRYVFISVFVLFFALLCMIILSTSSNSLGIHLLISSVSALLFGVIFFYNNGKYGKSYTYYMNIFFTIVTILIIIVALAFIYKVFASELRHKNGILGILIDMIFLIPCSFSDMLEFVAHQFRITTNSVLLLFILEILLIILYFIIPIAINKSIFQDKSSIPIISTYKTLDTLESIPTDSFASSIISNYQIKDSKGIPSVNYSLSMWIYLNQQLHNNTDVSAKNIFNYGSETTGVKPQIMFVNSASGNKNSNLYQFTFTGFSDNTRNNKNISMSYFVELPSQKWNYIVFNYYPERVELYINGEFARVFKFDADHPLPVYDTSDTLTIGDKNGLDGAICNVMYYSNILTRDNIVWLHRFLSGSNPPILINDPESTVNDLSSMAKKNIDM